MKIKYFSLALVCVFLSYCSMVPREKTWVLGTHPSDEVVKRTTMPVGEQTVTFDGLTYDRVWDACEQTLIRLGYSFFVADKIAGEFRVQGTAKSEFSKDGGMAIIPTETRHVSVLVKKTDGGVAVQASLLISKGIITGTPMGRRVSDEAKNEVDRFFKGLKKKLK